MGEEKTVTSTTKTTAVRFQVGYQVPADLEVHEIFEEGWILRGGKERATMGAGGGGALA